MSEGVEREVKLEAGAGFVMPELDGVHDSVKVVPLPEIRLKAVYLDTADLRLTRSGLSLRHREQRSTGDDGEARGEWTLKLPEPPEGDLLVRRELTWPGPWGAVPAPALSLVRAYRRRQELAPVATLVTRRQRVELRDGLGDKLGEVDDDAVSVMDGDRLASRFREVEVELSESAPPDLLPAVLGRLEAAGAVRTNGRAKVARALGARADEPPDVVRPKIGRRSPASLVVACSIADAYLRLVEHDPGVHLDEDPEQVHKARVATRRLRSDLRTFKVLLDRAWVRETRQELGWLASLLGEVRDADVLSERLRRQIATLDSADAPHAGAIVVTLTGQRDTARARLLEGLDSDRYAQLLDRLVAAASAPPTVPARGSRVARRVLPELVAGPWKSLRRAVSALDRRPSDDELHQVRIRSKRLRYACEAASPVIGDKARAMGAAAAGVQGVLGDLHDCAVAERWLREAAEAIDARGVLVTIGELVACQRLEAAVCRDSWEAAWNALDRKKLRSWLS